MTDGPAIDVRGLTKHYGATVAVDDLTFSVPRGSVTRFLGPNGAGKTTTLRVLLGLAAPTQGQTFVLGARYVELERPLRRVGASLEVTGFHPRCSVSPRSGCSTSRRTGSIRPAPRGSGP